MAPAAVRLYAHPILNRGGAGMDVRSFTYEDFRDHVGTAFGWRDSDPELRFVLEAAEPIAAHQLPDGFRAPFRLIFRMADARVFPQHLYRLDHPAIGEVPVFLVPESQDVDGVRYCATFA
jgi:hypothetical protein